MPPADRADTWNQTDPVRGENEDEDAGEEPERPVNQVPANDAFQETVEGLDEEFQEILRSVGHFLHGPGGDLGKEDEADGDDPHEDHGVGDREPERAGDLDGLLRQAMLLRRREGDGVEGKEDGGKRGSHADLPYGNSLHSGVTTLSGAPVWNSSNSVVPLPTRPSPVLPLRANKPGGPNGCSPRARPSPVGRTPAAVAGGA